MTYIPDLDDDVAELRFDAGTAHNPVSLALVKAIQKLDIDDRLDLKLGGDGDLGEDLAYYLDELLDRGEFTITRKPPKPGLPPKAELIMTFTTVDLLLIECQISPEARLFLQVDNNPWMSPRVVHTDVGTWAYWSFFNEDPARVLTVRLAMEHNPGERIYSVRQNGNQNLFGFV